MRYHNTRKKPEQGHQKGFTLIELMIVIAIIGILSAIAIPNFLSYRKKGMDQAAISSANSFYKLALADFADTGSFNPYDAVTNPPPGFTADSNLNYSGSINFTAADVGAGTMTFQHSGSNTTYTLQGSDGSIS